jgi:uncharacterized Zn finger protein (UPF0148 family)
MVMACPHCGEHLLHKRDGALLCCRCGHVRHDLASVPLLSLLQRHGILLAVLLLGAPLALGTAAMERMRTQVTESPAQAETMERSRQIEQSQLALPSTVQVSQARPAEP